MVDCARSPAVAVGDRIRLVRMHADPAPVAPDTRGTVTDIDALGTVHVAWDGGVNLGLVPEIDRYERVEESEASR